MLSKITSRALGEIVAIVSVVVSLIFVGMEFRQSTIASRAAAYQEIGFKTSSFLFELSNRPRLYAILKKISSGPKIYDELNNEDRAVALLWIMGALRIYETIYMQVELGLLDEQILDDFGWVSFRQQKWFLYTWHLTRNDPAESFVKYLDAAIKTDEKLKP